MKLSGFPFWIALVLSGFCMALAANAADLPEIKARGELHHLGIRYANFVTGAGDGFDAELTQGFTGTSASSTDWYTAIFIRSSAICLARTWCAKVTRSPLREATPSRAT